jgi:hypothetical protein
MGVILKLVLLENGADSPPAALKFQEVSRQEQINFRFISRSQTIRRKVATSCTTAGNPKSHRQGLYLIKETFVVKQRSEEKSLQAA